jgi:hypothetical protein
MSPFSGIFDSNFLPPFRGMYAILPDQIKLNLDVAWGDIGSRECDWGALLPSIPGRRSDFSQLDQVL